jgi:hypothetical protein
VVTNDIAAESATNRAIIPSGVANDYIQFVGKVANLDGTGGITWQLCVWSRKNAGVKPVQTTWVDDRPDYQRRRADQGVVKYSLGVI